jgi:hypothetical protein
MPLQLIIVVTVAAVSTGVILAWLQPWERRVDLQAVSPSPTSVTRGVSTEVVITAISTKGNPLPGVVVMLDGCGISGVAGTTGDDGTVSFTISPVLEESIASGKIDILARYSGTATIEKTNAIIVV